MSTRVKLLAGTPNDDNRDYLPAAIKGTDMTVNENGNGSHRYPERLQEFHDTVNGVEGTWYEYVPTTYDPSKKTPLVFGMHGGLMTGWGHAIYTSWVLVAERDGWLNRQVTQALLLYFGCALGAMLLRMVFSALLVLPFFGWLAYSGLSGLIGIGMELAMILFALRAADRMRKGLDSDIPFASGLAEMIF